jgi:large subunit ribosomal protein L29
MKAKEIRDLTNDELATKLSDLKDELFKLRFRLATGQLENPMLIKDVRRTMARIQTIKKQREIQNA